MRSSGHRPSRLRYPRGRRPRDDHAVASVDGKQHAHDRTIPAAQFEVVRAMTRPRWWPDGRSHSCASDNDHQWNTRGRGRSRLDWNNAAEIANALALAVAARRDGVAAWVLRDLAGARLPVPSAILTALDRAQYTITDFRALEPPRVAHHLFEPDQLLACFAFCRALAIRAATPLPALDRASWQWSKETWNADCSRWGESTSRQGAGGRAFACRRP
jgi:hypothetical protein